MTRPLKQCTHGETEIRLSPLIFADAKKWLAAKNENARDQLAKDLVRAVVNEEPPYTDDQDHTTVSAAAQLQQELRWAYAGKYNDVAWKAAFESVIRFYVDEVGEDRPWIW